MKTKSSIWLTICTLVLCLGVMTFGVYSALSANLNINGSLGFNMHNATVTVQGTIQNVAVSDDNWQTATPTTLTIERTIMGGETTTTTNLDLEDLYFYADSNMIFTFTFTNISETAIQATFPLPQAGAGVTVLTGNVNEEYTKFANNVYTTRISKNSSKTLSFALSMDSITNGTRVAFQWQGIIFEEAQGSEYFYTISDGTAYNNYLATKIGTYNETAIEWVAFAVKGTGTNCATKPTFLENETVYSLAFDDDGDDISEATWYSLSGVDMNGKDYANHTFWFIQRDVTMEYAGEYSQLNSYLNSTYISDIGFEECEQLQKNTLLKRERLGEFVADSYRTDKPFSKCSLWLMGLRECCVLIGREINFGQDYSGLCIVSQDWWLSTYYDNSHEGHIEPNMGYCSMPSVAYSVILPENTIDNSVYIRPAFMLKINEI